METTGTAKNANWKHPTAILATGLWFGRFPVAPGTIGAIWGLPLAWAISLEISPWLQAVTIVGLFAISVPICTRAAAEIGGKKDPGAIVLDEIVSLPVTFFLLPQETIERPVVLLAGFALHRLFDITKPPPARQLERLPSGLGIMADDIAAGIYSGIALRLLLLTGWLGNL